ncbi:TMV resistance protein N-like [Eucalyptus grandis]|uniref:TMV resistance protein N-like n=1 Tax=Eucalyptus grandis TaxID=71139 RepID=UPI00192EBB8F|nr:TMV resistance protein N-like [Eucalyptus grandis]
MAGSGKRRPLDCSPPHELTSNTPFSSKTSKKRKMLVNETNSQASSETSYEVFLSFRGPDTRHEFTDCLYHAMKDAGILVFMDDESLRVGEKISDELLQAIENSEIYIPIFSKNYAASHWCLEELAHMVDCTSKFENKKILPIFLDVEPEDVKLKTKLYSEALPEHRKKFCTEVVESWKKALIDKGMELEQRRWANDAILSGRKAMTPVTCRIEARPRWGVNGAQRAKAPEGDGDNAGRRAMAMTAWPCQGEQIRSVIRMVSVKLKVAYQNVTEHIVGVDDHVEAIIQKLDAGSNGVRFLTIHGMGGVGKTTLAKVVFNKLFSSFDQCCFLVDVRESSTGKDGLVNLQKKLLSKLLGPHSIDQIDDVNDGINKIRGALRNKNVLIVLDDVDEKEQLKSLAENGSWFGLGSRIIVTTRNKSVLIEAPNVSTYEVSEMEFDHALELFSRHAFNSDSPPNHRVSLSKKIVDTLGRLPLALEIIGSSLLGKAEELWIDTWKKLQKAPPKDVQKKLMITYEREIIRQENSKHLSERSRVWKHDEALSILQQKERSCKVEALSIGIHPVYPFCDKILTCDEFADLQNLRFFEGRYIKELPNSVGKLQSLVELDLSLTSISNLPDSIGNLKQLKVLRMSQMRGITKLPSAIGLVEKLEELNAQGCCNLTGKIPKEISRLSHLRILDLSNTRICGLPAMVSHLSDLHTLKVENYPEPKQLPELPLSLTCLTWGWQNWLDVKYQQKWSSAENYWQEEYWQEKFWQGRRRADKEDEDGVDNVAAKEFLQIGAPSQQETPVITLPTSISSQSQLKTLKLCCKYVQFLPQLPSSLRVLQLRDLKTTRSLDFSNLKDLSILTFDRCLLEFSSIFDAESEELRMELCELRQLDAPLQLEMKRLRSLEMAYCKFLPEVLDLSRMKNLEKVGLGLCLSLVEIHGLEELGSLCSLSVGHCPSLERMSDLSKLKNLPKLQVHNCGKLNKQEIYTSPNAGEFGGDSCNVGDFDLSPVPYTSPNAGNFGSDTSDAASNFTVV